MNFAGLVKATVISIHALREEGDLRLTRPRSILCYFYPRPPRGGRRRRLCGQLSTTEISIHALREEGDLCHLSRTSSQPISIHALREEGDYQGAAVFSTKNGFLSTPSARRATSASKVIKQLMAISIHALREEGDLPIGLLCSSSRAKISIHALREEGDEIHLCLFCLLIYFYPRPPRGGRLRSVTLIFASVLFLSTPSARRATSTLVCLYILIKISIHALREEGDRGLS